MERRDFLKNAIGASIIAGSYSLLPQAHSNAQQGGLPYDLVAVRGGAPDAMFDKAIEAFGGMGKFVKKGQTVVVKPNIGWDAPPERGSNTNPQLVKRIVEHCYNAGAKKVYIFDNTCDPWQKCYSSSGIEKAAKHSGAVTVTGKTESHYKKVSIPQGKSLKESRVHYLILESDVFINVPILKNHGGTRLTIALKNLMGIVWDRRWWHRNDLHQCIADFGTFSPKPTLNVVDAYRVMLQNGPRGVSVDDVALRKTLIVSPDMVAADAAAAKVFGMEPEEIDYIKIAHEMKVGNMNLDQLKISRITM